MRDNTNNENAELSLEAHRTSPKQTGEGLQCPHPRDRWPLTVHGHLVDLGGVVLLNVPQDADVVILHKVDGHPLAAVAA